MTRIKLSAPELDESDWAAVRRVLEGRILSRGESLREFEQALAARAGRKYGIGVSSGTAALHLGLVLAKIGSGDKVITTAYSVPASANPIWTVGARPLFVDIDPATRALDPKLVEGAIDDRTRAILAVHPQAAMADMPALRAIAERHDLVLIEDACEALGSAEDQPAGATGHIAAFGFYPNKPITTGEGGMLLTDDDAMAQRARRLRNHGRTMDGRWLDQDEIGFNYRLSEIAAALGVSQLSRLDEITAQRKRVADLYDALLGDDERIILPPRPSQCGWFCYVVLVPASRRDDLIARMAEKGIECGRYFAPLHRQPALAARGFDELSLPITERISASSLALPMHNRLSESEAQWVARTLVESLRG